MGWDDTFTTRDYDRYMGYDRPDFDEEEDDMQDDETVDMTNENEQSRTLNPPTITLSPACEENGVHSACTWELCECSCHRARGEAC